MKALKQHAQFEVFSDNWLARRHRSGVVIHCRSGCSGCCHFAVHSTYPEAVQAAGALDSEQKEALHLYIMRLRAALPHLATMKDYLKVHRLKLGPCPFLGTGETCSIYPVRPLSCRALLSTRPADWCKADFSQLTDWDKLAYESSLDRQVVAWPTHYVAATQDFARELETSLLDSMREANGWALSGSFAAMVWLELQARLGSQENVTGQQLRAVLVENGLDNHLLFDISSGSQNAPS